MRKNKKGKTITRRDFLKGFSGGALGASLAPKFHFKEASLLPTPVGNVPFYRKKRITLNVNEKFFSLEVDAQETLLNVLRNRLGLRGAKRGCERGECGACTVLLDGEPVYSCLVLAIRVDGREVTTVEGLEKEGKLHPVQEAFIEEDAYQCGFCTPGFIISSVGLLNKKSDPGLEEIKEALSGNICRCGNHSKIFEAVSLASRSMRRP